MANLHMIRMRNGTPLLLGWDDWMFECMKHVDEWIVGSQMRKCVTAVDLFVIDET